MKSAKISSLSDQKNQDIVRVEVKRNKSGYLITLRHMAYPNANKKGLSPKVIPIINRIWNDEKIVLRSVVKMYTDLQLHRMK